MQAARLTVLALAVAAAFPAAAQSNAELLQELRALRERVTELEKKLAAQPAAPAAAPAAGGSPQWGMTPEQARELNRIAVKAESLQDNFTDQGFKGLKISGQIDPTYIANRNRNNRSFVFLNGEEARYTYDNSYFGMAVLDLTKETESGTIWKLTLAPERGTGALTNSGSIVHEASVSIPLTDLNTRLWVGQIPDWTGYELTLPAGNKLITHNLLFDFTAPTNYTGAVVDMTRGKWWTRIGLANFNSPRQGPGNNGQALIYRVDYSKGEFDGFGFTGLHGKGPNFAADKTWIDGNGDEQVFVQAGRQSRISLLEFDAYYIRGDWSLYGQVSWGMQRRAAIYNEDGVLRDARWWGLSGTAAYKFMPRLEGIVRADYLNNRKNGGGLLGYVSDDDINGIGRGLLPDGSYAKGANIGANRYALTFGLNYLFDENTTMKLEYRFDGADQPVFARYDGATPVGLRKTNQLFGASVVVSF